MNQFGNLYAQYYDLLYRDKEYDSEVSYIDNLLKNNLTNPKTILDLGCGTGKHAELLCNRGYSVHGVDLSSEMLAIAEKRRLGKENQLCFTQSNIRELSLEQQFDAVISLFHVMSYHTLNSEVLKAFEVAKNHLADQGLFIFDFWYGPAVLTDLPVTRVKRLDNNDIRVTRIAEPLLYAQENVVDVNYDIFIENTTTSEVLQKRELHKMRYFFDTELQLFSELSGFEIVQKHSWMDTKTPNFSSWNVVWIVRKKF